MNDMHLNNLVKILILSPVVFFYNEKWIWDVKKSDIRDWGYLSLKPHSHNDFIFIIYKLHTYIIWNLLNRLSFPKFFHQIKGD